MNPFHGQPGHDCPHEHDTTTADIARALWHRMRRRARGDGSRCAAGRQDPFKGDFEPVTGPEWRNPCPHKPEAVVMAYSTVGFIQFPMCAEHAIAMNRALDGPDLSEVHAQLMRARIAEGN